MRCHMIPEVQLYDLTVFLFQWDLVCDRAYLIETSQTVMVIGVLVGAIVFTTLADNYGRKPIFLFSQCAMVVVGVATAFINSYYMFAALRLLAGALQQVGETTHDNSVPR